MSKLHKRDKRKIADPEWISFQERYRRFPGVKVFLDELCNHHHNGTWIDAFYGSLEDHAVECIDEMLEMFNQELNYCERLTLLKLIAHTALPKTLPILMHYAQSQDEDFRYWAIRGLQRMKTKESRRFLWEAGLSKEKDINAEA